MPIDLSRSRVPPEGVPPWPSAHFSHQPWGVEWLTRWDDVPAGRVCGGVGLLGDDTGAGKGKQVIDAACVLFVNKLIRRVIVVAPGAVRSVWSDKDLGELTKHLWFDLPCTITEYHARTTTWLWQTEKSNDDRMDWYVSNYEFLRSEARLDELLQIANRETLLVLDESAMVKNWQSQQTKAMRKLRKRCGRVWLLNGTPIADKPFDIFAQANLMDPGILGITSMTKFKATFAVMGGYMVDTPWGKMPTQVLRWQNLDVLQQRMAPYVLRRLKDDMGLPPKLAPVVITCPLTAQTWEHYKNMRDQMVVELSETHVSSTMHTMVKIMRLSQITSGFLGGVEQMEELDDDRDWDDSLELGEHHERNGTASEARHRQTRLSAGEDAAGDAEDRDGAAKPQRVDAASGVVEIGREKLDALLAWLELKLEEDPNLKLLIYTRFRAELLRTAAELRRLYPKMDIGTIYGGNKKAERADAKRLMDPRTAPAGPATVLMTSAGARGLTLTASHTVFRMSRDASLYIWQQGDDRVHRPTQVHPVSYTDLTAVGPKGQRTCDKDILMSLLQKLDVSTWVTSEWVTRLINDNG